MVKRLMRPYFGLYIWARPILTWVAYKRVACFNHNFSLKIFTKGLTYGTGADISDAVKNKTDMVPVLPAPI